MSSLSCPACCGLNASGSGVTAQDGDGPARLLDDVGDLLVRTDRHGDVPELAARSPLLAVEVDTGLGVRSHGPGQGVGSRLATAANEVDHDGGGRCGLRRPQRQVENRSQVLGELAGDGPVLGPVTGVVRTHRQLVDVQARGLPEGLHGEELDGEHPGHPGALGDRAADELGLLDGGRGLVDGNPNLPDEDEEWWERYVARLRTVAEAAGFQAAFGVCGAVCAAALIVWLTAGKETKL